MCRGEDPTLEDWQNHFSTIFSKIQLRKSVKLLEGVCVGEKPTLKDWENHLSTIFPEIRLKKFIEMRGADGGPWKIICALSALWVGLLYDSESQAAALDMIKDWTRAEHDYLRVHVWLFHLLHVAVDRCI